jgi:phosphomannomutase
MAWHGKFLGELLRTLYAEFGEYHYGRVDLDVKPGQKEKAIAYFSNGDCRKLLNFPVTRSENLDGIKIYLADIGWAMVRASGTENLLRIYCETNRPETTRRVLDAVVATVHRL